MAIYIIGDLHLGFSVNKPMHIFGEHWRNHADKIKNDWVSKVKDIDTVILAGDSSWAMRLDEARVDLEWIKALPGKKFFLKGNHDYWWSSVSKMKQAHPEFDFLYNNSLDIEGQIFVGTRGWSYSKQDLDSSDNVKIFKREVQRLKNSIESAPKDKKKICILHYPPFSMDSQKTEMNKLIEESGIEKVYFGHIHDNYDRIPQGLIDGVNYRMISADYLNFKLEKIR